MKELDEMDLKIIELLQEDPKSKYTEIGEKIGINKNTVTSRIRKMREMEVIEFPSCIVDPIAAGWTGVAIVLLTLEPTQIETTAEKLATYDEITCLGITMGTYDLAFQIVTKDTEELWQFINSNIKTIKGLKDLQVGTFVRMLKLTHKMNIKS